MTEKDVFSRTHADATVTSGLTFADAVAEPQVSKPSDFDSSGTSMSWKGAGTWTGIGGGLGAASFGGINYKIGEPAVGFGDDYYQSASLLDKVIGEQFAKTGAGLAIKGGIYGLAFGAAVGGIFYLAYKTDEKKNE